MTSRNTAIVQAADRIEVYNPSDSRIRFASKLSTEEKVRFLNLTRTNMRELYNACTEPEWRWCDDEKSKMFSHPKSRFLVIQDEGFVCFRFLVDSKRPVVYVYELQIEKPGLGLGTLLMDEIERLCRSLVPGVRTCILTCFNHNVPALSFYKKLGFSVDVSSPKPGSSSYCILSKRI
jgi:hypothetical protein